LRVPITPHVLRHTLASVAGDLGYSELTIAGLLGHAGGSVSAGYVHLDAALIAAADRVSSVLAAALDGELTAQRSSYRQRNEAHSLACDMDFPWHRKKDRCTAVLIQTSKIPMAHSGARR